MFHNIHKINPTSNIDSVGERNNIRPRYEVSQRIKDADNIFYRFIKNRNKKMQYFLCHCYIPYLKSALLSRYVF